MSWISAKGKKTYKWINIYEKYKNISRYKQETCPTDKFK